MPAVDLLKEADRQLTICNACRYCEGYCAVWPAMELRRTFKDSDILYMANLCFDCRACYYACQFAPPHEFAVNIPEIFAQIRTETYQDYAWPNLLARMVKSNALAASIITVICVLVVFFSVLLAQGPAVMFSPQLGDGAFFRIVPYIAMTGPAMAISLFVLVLFSIGAVRFWRDTQGTPGEMVDWDAFMRATKDAFGMRYLKGDGSGCNYPDEQFTHSRRVYHHLTFYGFLLDLASTTVAAIYHHGFHWESPYAWFSLPVVLGTVGGIMLMIGTAGLLYLKWQSDRRPSDGTMMQMDVSFILILFLTALTGMLLLLLRETAAMGTLLAIHLGVVAAFFIMIPYGKLAHVVYRYAALIRNAIEQRKADAAMAAGHH
ncbi:MAG: tricarballylate utilization 4Fe-4S protein TcuB [Chloroflexota bacterium]